jgi:8-oxo-dGTP pyrophosphatase MutT (NUDIX family)
MNAGESFLQAAVRELQEETGLVVDPSLLAPLGIFSYKPKKDLALYHWRVAQMPAPESLLCKSTFKNSKGQDVQELDKFKVVDWQEASLLVNPDMQQVLKKVEKKIQ